MPRARPRSELPGWWRWALDHEGLTVTILILAMPLCAIAFPAVYFGFAVLVGWDVSADNERFTDAATVLLVSGMVFPILVAAILGFGLMRRGWVLGVGFGVAYVVAVFGQWAAVIFSACVSALVFAVLRGLDQRSASVPAESPDLTDATVRSPYSRRSRHG